VTARLVAFASQSADGLVVRICATNQNRPGSKPLFDLSADEALDLVERLAAAVRDLRAKEGARR